MACLPAVRASSSSSAARPHRIHGKEFQQEVFTCLVGCSWIGESLTDLQRPDPSKSARKPASSTRWWTDGHSWQITDDWTRDTSHQISRFSRPSSLLEWCQLPKTILKPTGFVWAPDPCWMPMPPTHFHITLLPACVSWRGQWVSKGSKSRGNLLGSVGSVKFRRLEPLHCHHCPVLKQGEANSHTDRKKSRSHSFVGSCHVVLSCSISRIPSTFDRCPVPHLSTETREHTASKVRASATTHATIQQACWCWCYQSGAWLLTSGTSNFWVKSPTTLYPFESHFFVLTLVIMASTATGPPA